MPNTSKDLLEFGLFRLDPSERRLSRGGTVIPLTAKAFDVLHLLVRNAGRTVTKEEFMSEVWAGTVVEEANLTDNISTLRQALEDDAREPKYVQTVPKRGYRFVAEVATTAVTPAGRRWLVPAAVGVIVLVLIVVGLFTWNRQRTSPAPLPLRSVAVFPFDALGSDAGETHLGIGLADSLITRLTNVDELVVRPAGAVFGRASRDAIVAAREQGVDAFVEGRIRKRDGRIRVTVQLVSVAEARTLWARTFDESASNLFAVEDRIAEEVAGELVVRMSERQRSRLARQHTPDPAAYELYGAGRYFWSKRTPEALEKSVECFTRAVAIDPRFTLAHAGLADAYSAMGSWNFKSPRETFPRAKEAALAALALDADLAEARTSLAYVKFRYDWDLEGAEREFRQAIAAKRNYATAHVLYAEYLIAMQRFHEAAEELQRARVLDPRSPYIAMWSAVRSYFMRNYSASAAEVQALLRTDPEFFIAREFLWAVYREAGDEERSVSTRLETLRPTAVEPSTIESLSAIYQKSGVRDYRRAENHFLELQSKSQYVPAVFIAMNHAQDDDADAAMRWLEKAYQERSGWLLELRADPVWDKIRDDPRFIELTNRVLE